MDKSNSKPKLKPANRYVSKEKVSEVKEKLEDISSSVSSSQTGSGQLPDADEQPEDNEVIVPEYPPDSNPPVMSNDRGVSDEELASRVCDVTLDSFCEAVETTILASLDNREAARKLKQQELERKAEEEGINLVTPENAVVKCVEYMNAIKDGYDMYKKQKGAIAQEQKQTLDTVKQQADTAKRLETVIGRIEDVQGVKAPKRPPFPSWACLAYLFWHWPMYGFAYLWQSKYFRRFCFLIAFFVMVMEFCMIVLLSYDNKDLHHDRAKYVTVRNWCLVESDTATINKFDYVDFIYSDVKFHNEDIDALHETVRKKYDIMMEKKQKQQNQKRRK